MLRNNKPTTASQRHIISIKHGVAKKSKSPRSLIKALKNNAARNLFGHITTRGRGGRVKRDYRVIDFVRSNHGINGKVVSIEYDPNRTSYIALVHYETGRKAYILAPKDLKEGTIIVSNDETPIKVGNSLKLKNIPAGTEVHNIILNTLSTNGLVRSAGSSAIVMGFTTDHAQIKLPSGEIRLVNSDCFATIGQLSNVENSKRKFGKAGTLRKLGFRPIVRGVAANPRYHPHGGGQGKNGRHGTGGPAVDKWGNKRFAKTRNNKKTDRFILISRKGVRSKLSKSIMN